VVRRRRRVVLAGALQNVDWLATLPALKSLELSGGAVSAEVLAALRAKGVEVNVIVAPPLPRSADSLSNPRQKRQFGYISHCKPLSARQNRGLQSCKPLFCLAGRGLQSCQGLSGRAGWGLQVCKGPPAGAGWGLQDCKGLSTGAAPHPLPSGESRKLSLAWRTGVSPVYTGRMPVPHILSGVFANQDWRVLSRRAAKVKNPMKDETVLSEWVAMRL
jgi:hypothetical protein